MFSVSAMIMTWKPPTITCIGSVRDALVQIVLRLRDDVLKDRDVGHNPSSGSDSVYAGERRISVPVLPSISAVPMGYDHRPESGSSLGLLSSSLGYASQPVCPHCCINIIYKCMCTDFVSNANMDMVFGYRLVRMSMDLCLLILQSSIMEGEYRFFVKYQPCCSSLLLMLFLIFDLNQIVIRLRDVGSWSCRW